MFLDTTFVFLAYVHRIILIGRFKIGKNFSGQIGNKLVKRWEKVISFTNCGKLGMSHLINSPS